MGGRVAAWVLLSGGLVACRTGDPFVCATDAQCTNAGGAGYCEADGNCSFDDPTCASGRRYGSVSDPAVAGTCVAVASAGTGDGSSTGVGETVALSTGPATGDAPTGEGDSRGGGAEWSTGPADTSTGGAETAAPTTSGSTDTGPRVDPDLVAWYRMDDLTRGVVDSSGQGHGSTCTQCPQAIDGVHGSAVALDGAGQHLLVPYDPAFDLDAWTLTAWIWVAEMPTTFLTVVGKPLGVANANSWEIGINELQGDTTVRVGWSDGTMGQGLNAMLPAHMTWLHVAATFSDEARLYFDGVPVAELTPTVVPDFDDGDVRIGADLDTGVVENFFFGRIDDVRIYRRALTAEEVGVVMAGDTLTAGD